MTSEAKGVEQSVAGELTDVFERPFTDPRDPRLQCARVLTKAEAEAVLEYRGRARLSGGEPSGEALKDACDWIADTPCRPGCGTHRPADRKPVCDCGRESILAALAPPSGPCVFAACTDDPCTDPTCAPPVGSEAVMPAFANVEARAEAWSDRIEIQHMVASLTAVFERATSPELLSRFRQQVMTVIQQAFIEGFTEAHPAPPSPGGGDGLVDELMRGAQYLDAGGPATDATMREAAAEIEALRARAERAEERIRQLAETFGVPDGGQYLNDWKARADALRAQGGVR